MTQDQGIERACSGCGEGLGEVGWWRDADGLYYCKGCWRRWMTPWAGEGPAAVAEEVPVMEPTDGRRTISYAGGETREEMDLQSHDRHMAARTCKALGQMGCVMAVLFPVVWIGGMLLLAGNMSERGYWFFLGVGAVYGVFGCAARTLGVSIKEGGKVSAMLAMGVGLVACLINGMLVVIGPLVQRGDALQLVGGMVVSGVLAIL